MAWSEADEQQLNLVRENRERLAAKGKSTDKLDEEIKRLESVKAPKQRQFGYDEELTKGMNWKERWATKQFAKHMKAAGGDYHQATMNFEKDMHSKGSAVVGGVVGLGAAGVAYGRAHNDRQVRAKKNPYYYRTVEGQRQKVKNHWADAATSAGVGAGVGTYYYAANKAGAAAKSRYGYSTNHKLNAGIAIGGLAGAATAATAGAVYRHSANKKAKAGNKKRGK